MVKKYLLMELAMQALELAEEDPLAEECRSIMDKVWLQLSDEDLKYLSERDDASV